MSVDTAYTATYTVIGMSCGHCVAAVTEELQTLAGVTGVAIDLPSRQVTVTGEFPMEVDLVRKAVETAGYQMG